jgi:carboxymethylenebutenolidase
MCYDPGARPPLSPISGGAGEAAGRDVILTASDGNRFSAFTATAEKAGGAGMVILPDVRGLHPFYQDLALRFAEAGVHATALDYFGRTAGVGPRGEDFEHSPHVEQTRPDSVAQDVAAAVAHVRAPEGGSAAAVYTVGFCFGGKKSFNQAARGHSLAGVIGFYGRVASQGPEDSEAPVVLARHYACPVLGLYGGADPAITAEDIEAFRRALEDAGVPNEMVIYDGAPHSFFDRTYRRYRTECDDAWGRILRFVESGRLS